MSDLEAAILDADEKCLENLTLRQVTSPKVPPSIGKLKDLRTMQVLSTDAGTPHTRWLGGQGRFDMNNVIVGSIPPSICHLQNLQELFLRGTYHLPDEIGDLKSLTKLILDCSVIEFLPRSIGRLKNLTTLRLVHCWNLSELPPEIGHLTSLKTLKVDCSKKIASLPPTIGQLSNLQVLDLHGSTCLKRLPESIGDLSSLTHLSVNASSLLTSFPASVKNLKNLESLGVNRMIPANKGLSLEHIGHFFSPNRLQSVDLSYSKLTALPHSLGNLKGLLHLNLVQTKLGETTKIPFDFLLSLTDRCPFLGYIELGKGILPAQENDQLAFVLACNRARFRTGFGCREVVTPNSCWPKLLSNASRAFAPTQGQTMRFIVPGFGQTIKLVSQEDAIYHLLTKGGGGKHFIEMLLSR